MKLIISWFSGSWYFAVCVFNHFEEYYDDKKFMTKQELRNQFLLRSLNTLICAFCLAWVAFTVITTLNLLPGVSYGPGWLNPPIWIVFSFWFPLPLCACMLVITAVMRIARFLRWARS